MVSIRRPLAINFLSTTGATLVHFVVVIVLARLLTPSEIGIFSITVVFVNIAHIFRDFGVGIYLQREADLTSEKIKSAIGVVFTTSWLAAIILFFASWWIADWFKEPGIAPVMRVLAIGFIFVPFGAVTNALLTREFAAGKQAIVSVISTATYTLVCLGLAAAGFGAMSMAWANLANILVSAIALAPFRPKNAPWLPSFRNWGDVINFGFGSLLTNVANAMNSAMPDVLLGKLGGANHVGLFSRAGSTVSIFMNIAGSTVNYGSISFFASAYHEKKPLPPLIAHATALVTGVGWPVLAITVLLRHDIVWILYGVNWLECIPAIPALALAGGIGLAFNYTSTVLMALGKPYAASVSAISSVFLRAGFGFLLFDGSIKMFAWAICIATVATVPIMLFQQKKQFGYGMLMMLKSLLPSLFVTAGCTLAGWLVAGLFPEKFNSILKLIILFFPVVLAWYLCLLITKHPLLKEVHQLQKHFLSYLGKNTVKPMTTYSETVSSVFEDHSIR